MAPRASESPHLFTCSVSTQVLAWRSYRTLRGHQLWILAFDCTQLTHRAWELNHYISKTTQCVPSHCNEVWSCRVTYCPYHWNLPHQHHLQKMWQGGWLLVHRVICNHISMHSVARKSDCNKKWLLPRKSSREPCLCWRNKGYVKLPSPGVTVLLLSLSQRQLSSCVNDSPRLQPWNLYFSHLKLKLSTD